MLEKFQSRTKAKVIFESVFYSLILLFLFVGNFPTLLVLALNRRMRTIPNMFVASLAISDGVLGVFSACPLALSTLVESKWPIHTLALMAVNRFFQIVKPLRYRRYFTIQKTTIMIFESWFYSMCAPLPYFLSGHLMVFHPFKFFCYFDIDSDAFTAFFVTLYVGFPACVIFYCYLRIFKTVRSHNNNFKSTGEGTSRPVNVEEVARTLFVIVVFFNLCWTPVLLIDLVDTIRGIWIFPREAYMAYSFLVTISSALNPVIHGVLNKNFQKEYVKVLRCSYCRLRRMVEPVMVIGGASTETMKETHC